jgi:hypothetical protein
MNYLVSMLSGESGVSVKRNVLVFLVLLFAYILIIDLHTGRHPSAPLQDQLHELLNLAFVLVFGEKAMNVIKLRKGLPEDPPKPDKPQ